MSQDRYNPAIVQKPNLLDQVKNGLNTKHYSTKTEEAYVHWMKRFILFLDKLIRLRTIYRELHIGMFFRAAGGTWNPNTKLWELPYKEAVAWDWRIELRGKNKKCIVNRKTNNKDPA